MINNMNLLGYFGEYEMEVAAAIIINFCNKHGKLMPIGAGLFKYDYYALNGFLDLIYYRWLVHAQDYNGIFFPGDNFIEKVQPYLSLEWRGKQNRWDLLFDNSIEAK